MMPHFNVTEACGAPSGFAAWIKQVIAEGSSPSLGLHPRFDPLDKLSEFEVWLGSENPPYPDSYDSRFEPGWSWAARLSLLRYRYLDTFPLQQERSPPPDDPDLARLWGDIERKKAALERAERKYKIAAEMKRAGNVSPGETRIGRRGNISLRWTMDALIDLFAELYGVKATQTKNGPAVRFSNAFFDGLDRDWVWASAFTCVLFVEDEPRYLPLRHLRDVESPSVEELRNEVRRALERSTTKNREPLRCDVGRIREGFYPVSGAFALIDDEGSAKWGTSNGKMPYIHGLVNA